MSTRESGPMPLYTTPIFGVSSEIFCTVVSSTRIDGTCRRMHLNRFRPHANAVRTHGCRLPRSMDCHEQEAAEHEVQVRTPTFRSVAMTTPFVALMPSDMAPASTAFSAYSIWTSLPLGLNVVSEKEYCSRRQPSVL